jgi:hypothetical protein
LRETLTRQGLGRILGKHMLCVPTVARNTNR